jgi:hypothetical protein
MKWIWTILLLVLLAGAAAILWPEPGASVPPAAPIASTSKPIEVPAKAPASNPAAPAAPAPAAVATRPSSPAPAQAVTPKPAAGKSPARETVLKEVPAGGLQLGMDRKIPHATVTPNALMRQPDGAILADGKYRIEGDGTRENPYRVGWDLLASANKTFIPRLKEDLMPQRVAMLDGAWVRIDGYFALPLMLQESSEILVMLNQWDGCCIGVPPTPYDAMEVKLVEPVKPNRRHAFNFGTVLGRLRVDPMLVENWLVGLYQLEEATLTQNGL